MLIETVIGISSGLIIVALFVWWGRKTEEFEVGQLVMLSPRKYSWRSTSPHYTNTMVDLQKANTIFEVEGWYSDQILILMAVESKRKRPVYVLTSWITPVRHNIENI